MRSADRVDRRPLAPPPTGAGELAAMPVHRIVMAWPEALEVLRERGLLPGAAGGRPLGSVEDHADVARELLAATAWRAP